MRVPNYPTHLGLGTACELQPLANWKRLSGCGSGAGSGPGSGVGAGFSVSGWRGCSPAGLAEEPPLPPPQPARRLTASSSEQGNTEVFRAGARVSCSMANPLRESSRCGAPVVVMGTYVLIGTFVQLKDWERL